MQNQTSKPGFAAEAENELVLSFLAVRRALGLLGLALPISLLLVALLTDEPMHPSISEFYHGRARDLFVGILCAIGVFMWAYVGYPPARPGEWPTDQLISRIAAVAAFGVALIPTGDNLAAGGSVMADCTLLQCWLGEANSRMLHYISAAIFFICLAVFCLVLFQRNGGKPVDAEKAARNRIYAICGWVIVLSMLALAAYGLVYRGRDAVGQAAMDRTYLVFVFESIGIIAFAISWLVKGETLKPLERMMTTRA